MTYSIELIGIARGLAFGVAALAAVVLLGWSLDLAALKSIHPEWISMKANTSLCFLLLAFALHRLTAGPRTGFAVPAAILIAGLIALATLAEYSFGIDLRIDQLLFRDHDPLYSAHYPGRMAPMTCVALISLALALLLLDWPSRFTLHPAEVLTLISMAIGFFAVTSYVYGVRHLYGAALYTQLAIHTASGLVMLSAGVLAARPTRGLVASLASPGINGRLLRRLLPAAILVPFGLGWLRLLGQQAGLYGTEYGVALTVIVTILLMGAVTIAVAFQVRGVEEEREQAEAELRTAVAKLEHSNRALDEFARVASHDLQEPLRTVRAFGGLLKADKTSTLSTDAREFIDFMVSGADRMNALVTDLLAYSRITTRARAPEPVALDQVAAEVLDDLRERIRETGATVRVQPLPTIQADRLQMRQLLQNLIGNAVKFRRKDVLPVVEVDVEAPPSGDAADDGPAWHEIIIQDNGIGIDPALVGKLFSPFQRLVRREDYEGTGIGLAICKAIVERHGGTIRIESKLGSGSQFVIRLPVNPPAGEASS